MRSTKGVCSILLYLAPFANCNFGQNQKLPKIRTCSQNFATMHISKLVELLKFHSKKWFQISPISIQSLDFAIHFFCKLFAHFLCKNYPSDRKINIYKKILYFHTLKKLFSDQFSIWHRLRKQKIPAQSAKIGPLQPTMMSIITISILLRFATQNGYSEIALD